MSASANQKTGRGCRLSPAHASAIRGMPRTTAPAILAGIMAQCRRRFGRAIANTQHSHSPECWVCASLDPTYEARGIRSRPAPLRLQPRGTARLGEVAHAQDVALALGHGDDAAGVQQVEDVARLDALVVGGQRQLVALVVCTGGGPTRLEERLALLLGVAEVL